MIKNLLLFVFGILILGACTSSPTPKTIYIVRHAEKMLVEDSDPELAQVGILRSTKLAQILADKDIKHVFGTDYKRTKNTALPCADQAGVQIEIYDPEDQEAFAEKLKQLEGNILVVGHSNTATRLVNILVAKGENFPDLKDGEYENIYIVDLKKNHAGVQRKTFKDY
jgi:broad specificity phosphatase PhoE